MPLHTVEPSGRRSFGRELHAYRHRRKITQAALAVEIGLPLGTLQNWERGHRCPNTFTRHAFEEIFLAVPK